VSDGVLELPVLKLSSAHPCANCGQCCTYIATQIDNPSAFKDYENIYWYLTHENVAVYIDFEGDWYLEFRTRCRHLTEAATCGIYADRPRVCSEFSFEECERTTKEPAYKYLFESYQHLLDFMRVKRPKAFASYMKKRRELLAKRKRKLTKAVIVGGR
jgi:hypothetical protein